MKSEYFDLHERILLLQLSNRLDTRNEYIEKRIFNPLIFSGNELVWRWYIIMLSEIEKI